MFRPRVIPCLLLKGEGLVKSVKFKNHQYIGDPINAVKIFNDKKADELIFLDITASKENRLISLDLVKRLGDECNMPFSVGGGIRSINDIKKVLQAGAEKVSINAKAIKDPLFIKEASETYGSSTIIVSIDIKKNLFGQKHVYINNGKTNTKMDPISFAIKMTEMGAGEILVNSIDYDGTMKGYDLPLIKKISDSVTIPVVAMGGAGKIQHFVEAVNNSNASAIAAGSFFVFHGPRRAVLINMPTRQEISLAFKNSIV